MPLIIFLLAISFFSIHIVITKRKMSSKHKIELLLIYLIVFLVGMQGLITFIAHVFYPEQTAALIGWKSNKAFQFEIGIANLAFSCLGFLSIYFRKRFLIAVIIGYSIFLWGAAIGHIIQYLTREDYLGSYFISDLVTPCILILTYLLLVLSESKADTIKGKFHHILDVFEDDN
jgi:Family of unknown function (DUF6790)